jgi:hypothetical protein
MKQGLTSIACTLLLLTSGFATAQTTTDALRFSDPWIRASVPGQKNGAGYLEISNNSTQPALLTAANSDRADRVEIHTIIREGGMAKMREVEQVEVPADGKVTLQPGGYHIMFVGLKQPFKEGEMIPVNLNFAGGQVTTVQFKVMAPTFSSGGQQTQHHMMKGH